MDNLSDILSLINGSICSVNANVSALNSQIQNVINTSVRSVVGGRGINVDSSNPQQPIISILAPTEDQVNKVTTSTDIVTYASSTVKYPSVKAIKDYTDSLALGLLDDRGNFDASGVGSPYPSTGGSGVAGAILKGDIWFVSVAGTIGTTVVPVGASVRALVNTPGQTPSNWDIIDAGLGYVAENVANKVSNGVDISTYQANTTKYTSTQSVYQFVTATVNASAANIDLQTVLNNGHTLVNNINLQGTDAGLGQSGINVVLLGQEAGSNNSGSHVIGIGVEAAKNNTADNVIGIGEGAATDNIGNGVIAIGGGGAQSNSGNGVFAIAQAADSNTGDYVTAIQDGAATSNTGDNVIAIGNNAGDSNVYDDVVMLGRDSFATNKNQLAFAGDNNAIIDANLLSADREYALPDASGTIALTSDIPAGSVFTIAVTLNNAQLQAGSAQLIGAPGPGAFINLMSINSIYKSSLPSSNPFSYCNLRIGTYVISQSLCINSTNWFANHQLYSDISSSISQFENQPVNIILSNPQVGGSGNTLTVYITYQIITI
jgi:hypothetical protein